MAKLIPAASSLLAAVFLLGETAPPVSGPFLEKPYLQIGDAPKAVGIGEPGAVVADRQRAGTLDGGGAHLEGFRVARCRRPVGADRIRSG